MTIPDPRPQAQEFVVRLPQGELVVVCESLDGDRWRIELRSCEGSAVQQLPMTSEQLPDLYLKIREAHRVECQDEDPDFFSLATRHSDFGAAMDLESIRLSWIYHAIGYGLRGIDREDSKFITALAETSAKFLEQKGETWRLAHLSRRGRGKSTLSISAMLAKPTQKAIRQLLLGLVPALTNAKKILNDGTKRIAGHLRKECKAEIDQFSTTTVNAMIHLAGEGSSPPKQVRRHHKGGVSLHDARRAALADSLIDQIAMRLDGQNVMPDARVIPRIVGLDPDHQANVKLVLKMALGVLHGVTAAGFLLRGFQLPPPSTD